MDYLTLKIVTPEKIVFEKDEIISVTIPTAEGEITILPHHIPIISRVISGEILVKSKNGQFALVTTNGFLKLDQQGNLSVLSDYSIRSEEIEIAKVEEAKKKAEEAMKDKTSENDFAVAEAELRKTLLELRVAQKHKSKNII